MRVRESKEKARDLHIIRRAALHFMFAVCYVCGHENTGNTFELTSSNGQKTRFMSVSDAQIDYCHLDARSENGIWSEENLTVGHHYCNMLQRNDSIEYFCSDYPTVLKADEIRSRSHQARIMADDMLSGKMFYPTIAKIAADMILVGRPHRTGKEWMRKLKSA